MSKLYRSREGDVTVVDTKTQLTTLGSQAAPGPLLVPAGANKLEAILVAFAPDFAVPNDGAFLVRLEGPGLPEGPETIVVGAAGVTNITGASSTQEARRIPLNVDVTPSNEILVFAETAGGDVGTVRVGVTLEFAVS